jgi:hypothetical protein
MKDVIEGLLETSKAVAALSILAALAYCALSFYFIAARKDGKGRLTVITFVGIPLAFAALLTCLTYFESGGNVLVRSVFILSATILPAVLFFLFVVTRRESLFNSYVSNLDRLGLLRHRHLTMQMGGNWTATEESEASRRRRIKSYLDRFAAGYGTLPSDFVANFQKETERSAMTGLPDTALLGAEVPIEFEPKTILPIIAATVLVLLGWLTALPPWFLPPSQLEPYVAPYGFRWYTTFVTPTLSAVTFAFLGAYFFSLQMIIRRFVRRDLGPNAYNSMSLRMILATLGVWVVQQVLNLRADDQYLLIVAFTVGAFPDIAWQFVGNAMKKAPGMSWALPSLKTGMPLSKIDGLTVWHEARLEEEDVENVQNLATVDIADLLLNTKIPPNRIIDWVDQALLLTYAVADDDPILKAQRFGLRTSAAFVRACESSQPPKEDGSSPLMSGFLHSLPDAERHQMRCVAGAIQTASNFPLILAWRGMDGIETELRAARRQAAEALAAVQNLAAAAQHERAEAPAVVDQQQHVETAPGAQEDKEGSGETGEGDKKRA